MTTAGNLEAGARNMLFNCGRAKAGEQVLIVREPSHVIYYGADLPGAVRAVAEQSGLRVDVAETPFDPEANKVLPALFERMQAADLTVFLARLGDQLRFKSFPDGTRALISYALDTNALGSTFGTAPYGAFKQLKTVIDAASLAAKQIVLTCPAGTRVEGRVAARDEAPEDTGLVRFPMSVVRPLPADGFSGRIALCGFLTGTGSMYYEPFSCVFDGPVFAVLKAGRLAGFEGSARDVKRANTHYDQVAARYGLDRDFVHSWHAGIHPGCTYTDFALDDLMRWSGSAFGNPRIAHFHTCGTYAPGEISLNLLDPTITLDGVAVWEAGRLYPDRVPGGAEILAEYPEAAAVFEAPDARVGL